MKADNFAKLILKTFFPNDNTTLSVVDNYLLECLCFQINRKVKYDLSEDGQHIIIMGEFYKFEDVTQFFDSLHIKYEIENKGFANKFHICENEVKRINPFLNAIRKHFEEQYGYVVGFSKYDGKVVEVSFSSELTEERLVKAIKSIASLS